MKKVTFKDIANKVDDEIVEQILAGYVLTDDDFENKSLNKLQAITNYMHIGIDLDIAHMEGASLQIEEDHILIDDPEKDIEILERIANMAVEDEEAHIVLFNNHGLFHDGGDQFDYSGTYYFDLIEILKDYFLR